MSNEEKCSKCGEGPDHRLHNLWQTGHEFTPAPPHDEGERLAKIGYDAIYTERCLPWCQLDKEQKQCEVTYALAVRDATIAELAGEDVEEIAVDCHNIFNPSMPWVMFEKSYQEFFTKAIQHAYAAGVAKERECWQNQAPNISEPTGMSEGDPAETPQQPSPAHSAVETAPVEQVNHLEELFRMQKELNEQLGVYTDQLTEKKKIHWILRFTLAMRQELSELVDSVPWKWWAKYQTFDQQNARVEVVDLLHFLVSLAQVLGMTADDLFQAYVKKNEVNFQRQRSGYRTKNKDDARHI